jgi:hypothetical protein
MSVVVKLEDVVEAMDLPGGWESLMDPETGEIVSINEDDRFILDNEEDGETEDMPDWQRDSIARIRRVLDSGRALSLPGSFDIHEWDLMRRFALSVDDDDASDELLQAIHGTGAFRLFKMTVGRLGLRDAWFRYRDGAIRDLARDWLEENGIAYVEEAEEEEPGRAEGN